MILIKWNKIIIIIVYYILFISFLMGKNIYIYYNKKIKKINKKQKNGKFNIF